LGHLLQVAGVEAEILVQAIAQQPHGLAQVVGVAAQIGGVHAISPLGLLQQAEQAHGHQPRVVEIGAADVGQGRAQRLRRALALLLDPLLHLAHAVLADRGHSGIALAAQGGCIKPGGAAKGCQQLFPLSVGTVAAGKAVEHLDQPGGKQGIALKSPLAA